MVRRLLPVATIGLVTLMGCEERVSKPAAPAVSARPSASALETAQTVPSADGGPRETDPDKRLRPRVLGDRIVIDFPGTWDRDCLIHRGCKAKATELETCAPGTTAPLWSTLPGKAEHFTDPHVSVRGQLVTSDGRFSTGVGCGKGQCCNGTRVNIVIAGPPYDLELTGLGCDGDESRSCCPFSARGEEVIATGIMTWNFGRLFLKEAKLCRIASEAK